MHEKDDTTDPIAPVPARGFPALRVLVLFALLVAAFAFYFKYFISQRVTGGQVSENLAVFDTRMQNLENSIILHEKRLKDLEEASAQKAAVSPAPQVEAVPGGIAPAPTGLAPQPANAASDERITALEKQIAALKTNAPGSPEGITQSIRLLSAYHRLSDKVIGGKPFAAELSSFEDLAHPDASAGAPLNVLTPYAESGIPTLATLLVTFDQAADTLTSASNVPAGSNFMQRLKYNLSHLVSVRRIDEVQTGNSPEAVVGRAQAHLEKEEIEAAIAEIKSLPDGPRGNFAAWLDDAQMVTVAPSLMDELEEEVLKKAFHAEAAPAPAEPPARRPAAEDTTPRT